ncbi:uncharacterized protein LOC132800264 isoform X1 [Ziziphus jujuba]|uniref:Uncharacterized protein LOC132800264 isoform X1 n=1 Tax=Ziziphus jujuba TaxID=326968 RepID=A0ABM3ZYL0_ZIZJJ|nr:uncharacterized protein LOC132800264 isoform X1 [Ziziphus jujuba]XP_060669557.1 uncharacterized protein LOC132800264 isoform X1 [Ziziphus jujuba]XP_060669558.1 uncharacterized protein LOC132800264 isoform X1 [Ziziphus jujuba]XP_060669559.1 uncharacterized protein LOC132800264 isoform X1 [Ziziphus jujuba]
MMEEEVSDKRKKANRDPFTDIVFSWSVEDIFNENLYQNQVERIPESFKSVQHYLGSYAYPLLEETRAELHSSMDIIWNQPFAEVISFEESKPYGTKIYKVKVDYWRNRFSERGKEPYKTLPGDVFILADAKPETVSDLQRAGRSWAFLSVTKIADDDNEDGLSSTFFKVKASKEFELDNEMRSSLFVIFLGNLTPNRRIWKALHMFKNLKVVEKILRPDSMVEEKCNYYSEKGHGFWDVKLVENIESKLNESQTEAVLSCLSKIHYENESAFELIWGPPGTGKTKTTATLLFTLLAMKFRTLICAPTNVAITEVASRVVKVVCDAEPDALLCSLGDILLFGNKERLKVGSDIQDIYLDYRVQKIAECLGSHSGWRHCFGSMINFLEDCVSQYHIFLENEMIKESEQSTECDIKEKGSTSKAIVKSFREFVRERFVSVAVPLRHCVSVICTHMGKSYISEQCYQNMKSLIFSLDSFEKMLFKKKVASKALEECFSQTDAVEDFPETFEHEQSLLCMRRSECLSLLRTLQCFLGGLTFPNFRSQESIKEFCFQRASLIFCTASTSYKLHKVAMEPLRVLVIDEAAQLKECESTIPLQLRGIKHAILVGDECQLPAMVQSKISDEVGFGRSLFERLSSQGCAKHLLNMQYRMHPSISLFPNLKFYDNLIVDAPIVRRKSYEIHCLQGSMYGPYSFINVIGGREEKDDDGRSWRNMVEVAIVLKILQNLYRAWAVSEHKLSIGVVSPYAAQVVAIQDRLGGKYNNIDGFLVKVKTIDGFQGGEEDIIIISSVRSNSFQSVGFISKPQRVNVALTRARHCLWILGSERTLDGSQTIWADLVLDAKKRNCFFNADDDKDLAKAILEVKKEFDQLDDLLNGDSMVFKNSRWKVQFSDNFLKSFKKLTSVRIKKSVLNLLLKLSSGWRPKKRNIDSVCGSSMQIVKQFKVEGLYVVSTTDIVKDLRFIQVLKIWDLLPLEDIPKLIKRLESIFCKYTDDFINLCNEKCLEGNLEVPKSWSPSVDIVRFKDLSINETGNDQVGAASDGRSYVENSKVSESLLLMKFYSLSSVAVNHLMSDHDGRELDLPFEVTDQEMEIILFDRSSFILGRSGTGKTTVLTMKLFQKEKLHQMADEAFYGIESNSLGHGIQDNDAKESSMETGGTVLRQLFVTVSPKLCFAVKQHVSHLKSFASGGKSSDESGSSVWDYIDDEEIQFKNIPDSFVNIPPNSYPLVITFHKFLMMLDGTLSNSYFERFLNVPEISNCKMQSSRSVMLPIILRTKEVNYERFSSSYWPHFNSQLTKNLDPSRVFTEIISYIKGGLQSMESIDGKINREDYVLLSEGRASSLSKKKREIIYDIFQSYEKMKMENGEYDLADFVIELHFRLGRERYRGDEMDFVYIDEVQDLTMSQIALFKHVCSNVEEGFVFSGDTAQTIARGIDFRFQDIRNLFYKKFFLQSRISAQGERNEKGLISEVFQLTQNFRTHAGILKLSHSIIELIYCFFPSCIDKLKPESSLIYGEAPILLESGNNENAIIKIFGNPESVSGKIVGFGAEQVILVRDDNARKEISNYVGKQALVLTILECKGLEFQDVLLYDFFGSSPLTNKWRVIYEYMKEQDLLDSNSPSFPHFNESKHNILCSELKQLYVAVTRTRQRLWICETSEFSKPMFDYWKKKCLVQIMQLDDSLAQAMQVASSPEEWRSRGIKLYSEHNYEMATMCFERAGDTYWERRSKAAGLKSMADRMRIANPEVANSILREAAEIFDAIGKADSAARCFYDLGEYERAGRIYMEKCGESELGRAGECFTRAECYELAAEVYARGNFFSECLNVCARGKLFDMGLDFIQCWKQHATNDSGMTKRGKDIEEIEQKFLESCALHYHEVKDIRAMMKFVKAFSSMDLIREFLRSKGCFDELMLLEEESGNFLEAANIAKLKGDILLEVELLGKARNFREAATLILLYVLANSLWSHGSKGWPIKQFKQKQELLAKGKSFAKNDSDNFYELFCIEADIIANEQSNLQLMKNQMKASQMHKSITAEMLCVWKILDGHLSSSVPKYIFEEELVFDLTEHSETMISKNQVSLESMVYFWNIWKEKIVGVFEYLVHLESEDVNENESFGEFCLNFLGVRREFDNLNTSYVLLHSDADWMRDVNMRHFKNNGKFVSIDVHQLASAAQSYWSSELLFVGIKILEKLQALYDFPVKISDIPFCKSRALTHIYEVAKFLFESKFLKKRYHYAGKLQKSISLSTQQFFGYVFPLDWRKSLRENMVLLRGMDISKCLLEELIVENINPKNKLSYGQIGRIAMITLGSGKLKKESCEKILQKLGDYPPWKVFFENLCSDTSEKEREVPLICSFNEALFRTYEANWRVERDYISPGYFVYLVEHLLIRVSCFRGNFFTTKSSFVEWLMECGEDTKSSPYRWADVKPSLENLLGSMIHLVGQCLYNKGEMWEWIGKSPQVMEWIGKSPQVKDSYSLIVSRLVVIVCLINLNFGICQDLLLDLINRNYIIDHLPRDFHGALLCFRKRHPLYSVLAEALKKIGNDLVIVSSGENFPKLPCPASAIHVNMKILKCKNDILRKMFPRTIETKQGQKEAAAVEASNTQKVLSEASSASQKKSELPQSRLELVAKQEPNTQYKNQVNLSNDCRCVWEILDRMKIVYNGGEQSAFLSHAKTIKVDMEKFIQLLSDGLTASYRNTNDSDKKVMLDEVATMTGELKELSNALNESEVGRNDQISRVEELCKRLQSKRPKMEPILNQLFVLNNTNLADKESQIEKVVGSSEKSDEVKNTVVDERNVDSHKVDTEAAQVNADSGTPSSSSNADNKGKGNSNRNKKKKAKKGGKRK